MLRQVVAPRDSVAATSRRIHAYERGSLETLRGVRGDAENEAQYFDLDQVDGPGGGVAYIVNQMRSAFGERAHLQNAKFLHDYEKLRRSPGESMRAYVNRYRRVEGELMNVRVDIATTYDASHGRLCSRDPPSGRPARALRSLRPARARGPVSPALAPGSGPADPPPAVAVERRGGPWEGGPRSHPQPPHTSLPPFGPGRWRRRLADLLGVDSRVVSPRSRC